jgi:hypothetical protein
MPLILDADRILILLSPEADGIRLGVVAALEQQLYKQQAQRYEKQHKPTTDLYRSRSFDMSDVHTLPPRLK